MFIELIATFAAGIAAAALTFATAHLSGGRLPRYAVPAVAGLAMLAYAIWSEYSWASRTASALPEGVEVVAEIRETKLWKPWTYLAPQVTRFMALDRAAVQRNPEAPGIVLTDLYLFARWTPPARLAQLVDCGRVMRADVTEAALTDPAQAEWRAMEEDDPLREALCQS
jgi:Zn-dependent protease with chaperone function